MVSEETDLDVVKQCIEMIEQEALSLMGEASGLEDGKFEEVLSSLGAVAVPKNSPRNIQDKLSLISKGMNLLSEQIQVKTEELKHATENCETPGRGGAVPSFVPVSPGETEPVASEPVATAGSHKIKIRSEVPSPGGPESMLPPTPEQPTAGTRALIPVAGSPKLPLPQLPERAKEEVYDQPRATDWTPGGSPQSQPQEAPQPGMAATLYAETLARLAQSHEDMKHRILTLEAENKRLQDEATVRSLEERNRMAQIQTLLRDGSELSSSLAFASRGSARPGRTAAPQRSSKLKSRPEPKVSPRPRSTTPPRDPWHSSAYNRPAWDSGRTTPSTARPRATSSMASASSSGRLTPLAGRKTPPKPRVAQAAQAPVAPAPAAQPRVPAAPAPKGADSVPRPSPRVRAAPVPMPSAASAAMTSPLQSASLSQSIRSSRSSASQAPAPSAPRQLSRTSSPSRGGTSSPSRGRTLSPPRVGSTGTAPRSTTPAAPSSRPSSPRKFSEKELPIGWRQMLADAYCTETGRPFVDRIQLLDFTSTKKKEGSIYWVNARLRWADLRITDAGRVPKRGEVLALFVLQADPSQPRQGPEWLCNGHRMKTASKAKATAKERGKMTRSLSLASTWQVASMRILRNLPFHEQYSTVLMANVGVQLLHCALQMEIPRRVTHLVRPPSWTPLRGLSYASL